MCTVGINIEKVSFMFKLDMAVESAKHSWNSWIWKNGLERW